jgi:hypothetical protein
VPILLAGVLEVRVRQSDIAPWRRILLHMLTSLHWGSDETKLLRCVRLFDPISSTKFVCVYVWMYYIDFHRMICHDFLMVCVCVCVCACVSVANVVVTTGVQVLVST